MEDIELVNCVTRRMKNFGVQNYIITDEARRPRMFAQEVARFKSLNASFEGA